MVCDMWVLGCSIQPQVDTHRPKSPRGVPTSPYRPHRMTKKANEAGKTTGEEVQGNSETGQVLCGPGKLVLRPLYRQMSVFPSQHTPNRKEPASTRRGAGALRGVLYSNWQIRNCPSAENKVDKVGRSHRRQAGPFCDHTVRWQAHLRWDR